MPNYCDYLWYWYVNLNLPTWFAPTIVSSVVVAVALMPHWRKR